ncbi:3-hydroxyacyl-CoA dehydrogenase family protein [Oxalobacter sp. OttesenSCG-928-P03]|nr:3-hydroxyacyl-CoA dehydrogenase family protein [Oxalobacter sp. OttesenSCG-928-P03]
MHIQEIRTVACLGTGTMGHGIAFLAAKAGYDVRFYGRTSESLERGMASVKRAIALYEDNDLMPKGRGDEITDRIQCFTRIEDAAKGADMVMESVVEDLAVKQHVFAEAERHCKKGALLATDTSGLSLSAIAAGLKHPEYFLGIHFFTPPYLMPVVEVCPTGKTQPGVCETGAKWVRSLGNEPVVLEKEMPGLLINRIQAACLREALHIVEKGWASAETVDRAIALSLGRRYLVTGPIESADMGGLDILSSMLKQLAPTLGQRTDAGPVMQSALDKGDLGMKTGKGIYDWPQETANARRLAREQSLIAFLKADISKKQA